MEISSGFLFYPEKRGREKEMSKVVLITGASRGIGRAEAEKFAREGYQVIANYHNSKERMEQFAQQMAEQGLSVIPMQADVSDEVQVKRMVEEILSQFGHIDVLICNAGIARQSLFRREVLLQPLLSGELLELPVRSLIQHPRRL